MSKDITHFTCKRCGATLPFGQPMANTRFNVAWAGGREISHFEAAYCVSCAQSFETIKSAYDCSGCDNPIVDGDEILSLSLHVGTLIVDDLKFDEVSREEIYRVHSHCFQPAAAEYANSLPSLPG